jgi:hypothetical protein
MQIFDIVGHLIFERIGQGSDQSGSLRGQVDAERQYLGGRDQYNDKSLANVPCGIDEGAATGFAAARATFVNRDPADRPSGIFAESNDQKLCHIQIVPKLRKIGTTVPR